MKKLIISILIASIAACSQFEDGQIKPPLVYRIDIQQGNVITQAMLNKLKPGMDERQVKFIMGTPLLEDPFHPERWDYIFYEQEGGERAEGRRITLYFEESRLSHLTGDVKVTFLPVQDEENRNEKSVVVPDEYGQRGLFDKLIDRRPEINKEKKEKKKKDKDFSGALKPEQAAKIEKQLEKVEPVQVEVEQEIPDEATTEQASVEEEIRLPETNYENIDEEQEVELINAIVEDLEISETEKQDLEKAEAEDDKPGFFSRMWDKMTGE